MNTLYNAGYPGPGLGQAQQCGCVVFIVLLYHMLDYFNAPCVLEYYLLALLFDICDLKRVFVIFFRETIIASDV
jgi:hypothetical protein